MLPSLKKYFAGLHFIHVLMGVLLVESVYLCHRFPLAVIFPLVIIFGIVSMDYIAPLIQALAAKLRGDIPEKVKAILESVNKAHQNDKVFDVKLQNLESQISALNLKHGVERIRE